MAAPRRCQRRAYGLALDGFHAELVQQAADQITWKIRDFGFDMAFGEVPATITSALRSASDRMLSGAPAEIDLWAVHPGGRTVLDAVEEPSISIRRRLRPRARSSATTAICRRRRFCSCSKP